MSSEPGRDRTRTIAGRYRLVDPIGEGGMGTVWRARDEVLGREVAVKEVRPPAGLPGPELDRMYARLEREAWAAARVSHRNVITLYDVATDEGRPWIVMELVRGVSLADQLDAEGPMSPQRAAHVGAEVLAALRAAHEAGVLHRDVKPGNVLLANDGRVVLTDFGIARVEGTQALTMTGEVVGSPEFLAPERALGRTPGPESDLWSLGVLLYAAVEGHSPFRQDTPLSTLRAVVDDELPPPHRAGPLTPVLEGLLRKEPGERTGAEQAEHDLRIVGAGGTLRSGPVHAAPTATATRLGTHREPPGPPTPPGGTAPMASATTPPTGSFGPSRTRRRVSLALAAGLVVLLVGVGTLTYALMNGDDDGGSGGASGGGSSASEVVRGGSTAEDRSPTSSGGRSSAAGGGGSAGGGYTTRPAQSVRVVVHAVRGSYSGPCPPTAAEAPAFSATITVGRTPAEVRFRWVTRDGEASEPGWQTLSFPAGGALSRTVETTETAYEEGGTLHNEISVRVDRPVAATSNSVAYSVTCDVVTPTTSGATTASPAY
ncbi:serine/threonine-protein kinase [Streptomyces xanthii]|uniref:non-specific serine/threonine protein kinase n=1 Tax=Streptomyces xanthii TaxID=2768069 RepID=A0A7H1BEF8_9ACTN|nr:serine/threonine-protein kinase [Streptomyces xanthii]QNS07113.1 serine/threonine protein kinase [Streptomyces xanthii]